MDMSNAFTSGCMTYFPQAHIVYDKFHIVQDTNKRLDEVRKAEVGEKLAKRRARGYANVNNFMDMVYYINGGRNFHYPLKST